MSPKQAFTPWLLKAILGLFLQSEEFREEYFPILKAQDFHQEDKLLQTWAEILWSYEAKYKSFPTVDTLIEELSERECKNLDVFSQKPTDDQVDALLDYLADLLEPSILAQEAYVKDNAAKVIRFNAIVQTIKKHSQGLKTGDIDVEAFAIAIDEATSIASPVSLGVQIDTDAPRRTEYRLSEKAVSGIVTVDIPYFKENLDDGGLPPGALAFWLAATGGGKSTALIHVAKEASFIDGHNVLFVTCELTLDEILKRFDSSITGIPLKEVYPRARDIQKIYETNVRLRNVASRLRIVEAPMGDTTVSDIEYMIDRLEKKGFKPHVLIVDYADHLRSKLKTDAFRHEITDIWKGLKKIAVNRHMVVWTASQTNDAGTKASESEGAYMGRTHMEESRSKIKLADYCIGIARTNGEMQRGEARLIQIKSRHGHGDGTVIKIYPDFARARFLGKKQRVHKVGEDPDEVLDRIQEITDSDLDDNSKPQPKVTRKSLLNDEE